MKKININKEVYLNYYNIGYPDTKIAELMGISNGVLSRFRNTLQLSPNRAKVVSRNYRALNPTSEFIQVLIGTLIGDGTLELNGKTKAKNARLRFGHCTEQLEYLQFKVDNLSGLWTMPIRLTENKVEISSISHPLLTEYYNKFYTNGTKILPKDLVMLLKPLGLAILFMDDGSYDRYTNSFYISLCNFTEEENLHFIKFLKLTFGIDASIVKKGKMGAKYNHIYIKAASREIFKQLISPYIIPSMLYKLGK